MTKIRKPAVSFTDKTLEALREAWRRTSPDAGYCSKLDAAELTLDRAEGQAADEISRLIAERGYKSVQNALATLL